MECVVRVLARMGGVLDLRDERKWYMENEKCEKAEVKY
jgi:hypothetical protein